MQSALLALAWEFWQRQRWRIMLCVFGAFGICALCIRGIDTTHYESEAVLDVVGIISIPQVLAFVALILFGQCDVEGRHIGFIARLYSLPVSTRWLVATQMVLGTSTVFLMSTVTTTAVSIYSKFDLSPWCGGLIMAVAMAWSQAIIWAMPDFRLLRVAAFAPLGMVLFYGITQILGHTYESIWLGSPPWVYGGLCGLIAAAYGVALWGVARERRGDAQGLVSLRAAWARLLAARPMRTKPFTSVTSALFWGECRQKLYIMPLVIGLFLLLFLLLGMVGLLDPKDLFEVLMGIALTGFILGPPLFGIIFGRSGHFGRHLKIDTFTATLPVADRRLSAAVLKMGVTSLLLTSAICTVVIGLTALVLWSAGHNAAVQNVLWSRGHLDRDPLDLILIIPFWLSLPWVLLGLSISLSLTGRERVIGFVALCVVLLIFGVPLISVMVDEYLAKRYLHKLLLLLPFVGLGGTLWAYVAAARRGHLRPPLAWSALALWLILLAGVVAWSMSKPDTHGSAVVYTSILTYGALVLAPLAAAPLALAWNRHR